MKKIRAVLGGVLAMVLASTQAMASLTVADLAAPGDALLTVDSQSNLAWLDLTQTQGWSIDQVMADGRWAAQGFTFATSQQLADLVHNAGPGGAYILELGGRAAPVELSQLAGGPTDVLVGAIGGDPARADLKVPVVTVMYTQNVAITPGEYVWPGGLGGAIREQGTNSAAQGVTLASYRDPNDPRVGPIPDGFTRIMTTDWRYAQDSSAQVGVFLVRASSPVPEPSTGALMLIGLTATASVARRLASRRR